MTEPGSASSPFPPGFFRRSDETNDERFYDSPRLVTHIDDGAIRAVGALYAHLGLTGSVIDLMSSWVSHFPSPPRELVVVGMNRLELERNPQATEVLISDLNSDPVLPFADDRFDAATCCVSVDYLTRPVEVFTEVCRVLRPGGTFVCTFSNRCFPTKAIHGWLATDDAGRCAIVREYFIRSGGWDPPQEALCTPPHGPGDPLYAVWAQRS